MYYRCQQDRRCTYNVTLKRVRAITVAVDTQSYSGCVFVALGIQREMRPHHIVVCGLPGSTIFATLSHKRHDFGKKKREKLFNIKLCFDFLYDFCLKHFSF